MKKLVILFTLFWLGVQASPITPNHNIPDFIYHYKSDTELTFSIIAYWDYSDNTYSGTIVD